MNEITKNIQDKKSWQTMYADIWYYIGRWESEGLVRLTIVLQNGEQYLKLNDQEFKQNK